jgi:hypothetical protein
MSGRMNWQPIETAPKKGEVILYWPKVIKPRGSVLYEMIQIGHPHGTPNRPPTHWMPLPDPPKTA